MASGIWGKLVISAMINLSLVFFRHSVVVRERNTNYGTILSVWDKWLGTFMHNLDQARIKIGVGAYPLAEKVRFLNLLAMPFTRPAR